MAETNQFSTFFVDGHFFGVNVVRVQEVIRYQEMTQVPLAASVINGLINLRGQIVTAIDLRRRLELTVRADEDKPMNVIVKTEDGAVSLLVDEIGDVMEVDEASMEKPPENLTGKARELIDGVYKLEDRLLLSLDTENLINFSANLRTN